LMRGEAGAPFLSLARLLLLSVDRKVL
jgi:hypothetical protein